MFGRSISHGLPKFSLRLGKKRGKKRVSLFRLEYGCTVVFRVVQSFRAVNSAYVLYVEYFLLMIAVDVKAGAVNREEGFGKAQQTRTSNLGFRAGTRRASLA